MNRENRDLNLFAALKRLVQAVGVGAGSGKRLAGSTERLASAAERLASAAGSAERRTGNTCEIAAC